MSCPRSLIVASLLCLVGAHARAADYDPVLKKKARAHVDVARNAYNLGQFDEAVRAYEAAYRLVPMPSLLFNIGQCHRQAGNHERAIFFFDGYLREASPGPQQRAMVEDLVRECERELAQQETREAERRAAEAQAPPAPSPAPLPTVVPPPPPGPDAVAVSGEVPVEDPEASVGLHERWWFWVIVGVGVAAAGTGAALALTQGGGEEQPLPSGSLGTVDWR